MATETTWHRRRTTTPPVGARNHARRSGYAATNRSRARMWRCTVAMAAKLRRKDSNALAVECSARKSGWQATARTLVIAHPFAPMYESTRQPLWNLTLSCKYGSDRAMHGPDAFGESTLAVLCPRLVVRGTRSPAGKW